VTNYKLWWWAEFLNETICGWVEFNLILPYLLKKMTKKHDNKWEKKILDGKLNVSHKRDDENQVRSARPRWLKWRRVLKKHGPCPATGPDGRTYTHTKGRERGKRMGGLNCSSPTSKYWNERGSVSSSKNFAFSSTNFFYKIRLTAGNKRRSSDELQLVTGSESQVNQYSRKKKN
jgi:hypothetical protein